MTRRLEDRIKELSKQLIEAESGADFHQIAEELRIALAEYTNRIRQGLEGSPFSAEKRLPKQKP